VSAFPRPVVIHRLLAEFRSELVLLSRLLSTTPNSITPQPPSTESAVSRILGAFFCLFLKEAAFGVKVVFICERCSGVDPEQTAVFYLC
jgi:hypothetical protein